MHSALNEVEDTTAAVLMVDKYGGKDTPGNMAVCVCALITVNKSIIEMKRKATLSHSTYTHITLAEHSAQTFHLSREFFPASWPLRTPQTHPHKTERYRPQ